MGQIVRAVLLSWCFHLATFADSPCTIELQCEECLPDNMPLVTSHRAANGSVVAAAGDEVVLACGGGKFLAYPLLGTLAAVCERAKFRVRHDGALRHLLELGCQENVFEDVLHQVEHCSAPLQGRAYMTQGAAGAGGAGAGARHVAALCWDADRAVCVRARCTSAARGVALPPHAERAAPLSLLGNFNHMFDARTRLQAERLYSDDLRLNRRLRELLKHDRISFADQTLTSGKLLSELYFEDQNSRVSEFASNRVAVWRSVARGNLQHAQRDVGALLRRAARNSTRHVHVYAGTHGVMTLRTGQGPRELYLKPGRFPVPKYIWTVVVDEQSGKGLAVTVLNDPFVAVSEVRAAVFCESQCGAVGWLHDLRRHRNYEVPLYGLVFCCDVHTLAQSVAELPAELLRPVPPGAAGLLLDFA